MVTTGVNGRSWRATVTGSGTIEPWDGSPVRWFVAAEDRWHVPDREPTVRQVRLLGTAVTETRVRVPQGDVVQRVFSVPDAGGITVVEVENESPASVAIAFDRRDLLTERPIVDVPIEGIDLPADAFVMPLGHRATLRVGLGHARPGSGRLPATLPTAAQVARGWQVLVDRASRLVLPDGGPGTGLGERVTAERCEVALGSIPHVVDDPVGYALSLAELVRMGERPDAWLAELVDAVEVLGPTPGWDADVALCAADRVLDVAGEERARRDLARIVGRRSAGTRPASAPDGVRLVAWVESLLVSGRSILPAGFPEGWLGQSFECYGLPTVPGSSVSYAVRWHGDRPAVLWEQSGTPVELVAPVVAPGWGASESSGEALWPPPDAPTRSPEHGSISFR